MANVIEGRRDLSFVPINDAIKIFRAHPKVKAHDKIYRAALRQIIDFRDKLHSRYNLGNAAPKVRPLTESTAEALDRLARDFLKKVKACGDKKDKIDALSDSYVPQFFARALGYVQAEDDLLNGKKPKANLIDAPLSPRSGGADRRQPIRELSFVAIDEAIRKLQTPVIFHNLAAEEKRKRQEAHQEAMERILVFRNILYERYRLPGALFQEFGDKKGETLQALTESSLEVLDQLANKFLEEVEAAKGEEGQGLDCVLRISQILKKMEAISKKYIVTFCDRAAVYFETTDPLTCDAPTLMQKLRDRRKPSQAELLQRTADELRLDTVAQVYGLIPSPRVPPTSPRSPIGSPRAPPSAVQEEDDD
jgi:hypothetical protein